MKSVAITATTKAAVLCLVVIAWAAPLRADSIYFPNQAANGLDSATEDLDFGAPSIPTGTSGALAGKKYWILNLATYNGHNTCFEITTYGDATANTRIWVYDPTINDYRSLNNDFNNTVQSQAHVWIAPPSNAGRYVSPVISGFSSANNSMVFSVNVKKMGSSTTETQCTSGSTYKAKSSGNTFVNAN